MWTVVYLKQAAKDSKKIELIKNNLFENPSPYEKLVGDLAGKYSRRINIYTASFGV